MSKVTRFTDHIADQKIITKLFAHQNLVCIRVIVKSRSSYWKPNSTRKSYEFSSVHPSVCRCFSLSIRLPIRFSVTVFSVLVHYSLLCFIMRLAFNKHVKIREPLSLEKFVLCLKWGKWDICGPKINIFELSSKLLIGSFWNCTWWQALMSG